MNWTTGGGYNDNKYTFLEAGDISLPVIEHLSGGYLVREHSRKFRREEYPKPLAGPFDTLDEAKAAVLLLVET